MTGRVEGDVAFITGARAGGDAAVWLAQEGADIIAVDSGVEQLGRLDTIVANAGIGTLGTRLDRMKEDIWQEMIDVNLSGVWRSVKAGIPHLLAGGRGASIVLTSSSSDDMA